MRGAWSVHTSSISRESDSPVTVQGERCQQVGGAAAGDRLAGEGHLVEEAERDRHPGLTAER